MMPGLIVSQHEPGNGSQIGQNLNGSHMGQSLNGTYMLNNQTQTRGVTHTQSQQTIAPQVVQQVQSVSQQPQGTQQPQTMVQHNQFQSQLGQPGMGQPLIPTTTC